MTIIIKNFKRTDHGDKVKDELEVITPKGKLARAFVWSIKGNELSKETVYWRLRTQIMTEHNIIESEREKLDDWRQLFGKRYMVRHY